MKFYKLYHFQEISFLFIIDCIQSHYMKQKITKNYIINRSIYITVLFNKLDNWFEYVKKNYILEDKDITQLPA